MNPKISIGSWAFAFGPFAHDPWSFERILSYARESGYDGVEINGFAPHPTPELYDTAHKRKELISLIDAYDMGISGYAPDFHSVPPDLVDSSEYTERLKQYIAFAQELGTRIIRVDTVSPPGDLAEAEYAERYARLVDTWRRSGEIAVRENMTIVWEFEPGFWLNKPSEVIQLVSDVDSPAFKVLFDTSHAYMCAVAGARQSGERETLKGGVAEFAGLLQRSIGHFHLIDSDGTLHDDETSTHAAFGTGYVDFDEIISQLSPVLSPMEWWCVDFCFNSQVEEWGKAAMPYIRDCINRVNNKHGGEIGL